MLLKSNHNTVELAYYFNSWRESGISFRVHPWAWHIALCGQLTNHIFLSVKWGSEVGKMVIFSSLKFTSIIPPFHQDFVYFNWTHRTVLGNSPKYQPRRVSFLFYFIFIFSTLTYILNCLFGLRLPFKTSPLPPSPPLCVWIHCEKRRLNLKCKKIKKLEKWLSTITENERRWAWASNKQKIPDVDWMDPWVFS